MEQEKVSIYIDGEIVDQPKLIKAYRFWKKYHLKGGESNCPLCDCELYHNGLFVCENCCEVVPCENRCFAHNDKLICKDCCEHCQDEKSYEDAVNSKIDSMRGK